MSSTLIKNATIVNEGLIFQGSVLIKNNLIEKIYSSNNESNIQADQVIDAQGLHLLPGMIDDQVHFRDPGLTHKGDIYTESRAAVAGGITSFMEMPNTNPRTLTQDLLQEKYQIASSKSLANYSFYMGTSNDNLEEVLKTNPQEHCGIKIFLGASTGNMLVDNQKTIEEIFKYSAKTGLIIAVHSEDETIIQNNIAKFKAEYGEEGIKMEHHPLIRSSEACYAMSDKIIKLAKATNANLHILHLSTAAELNLLEAGNIDEKKITAEACVHHLWFSDQDYAEKGSLIKWNPAIKTIEDRDALRAAVNSGLIDIIATDHAPHTKEEKSNPNYFLCPSGGPLVQHALVACLELYHQSIFTLETIVNKTSHNIARRFKVDKRGFIREGYYADLTLIDLNSPWTVDPGNILYKCSWSPFTGQKFNSQIKSTWVNGNLVYNNGKIIENNNGEALKFNR